MGEEYPFITKSVNKLYGKLIEADGAFDTVSGILTCPSEPELALKITIQVVPAGEIESE